MVNLNDLGIKYHTDKSTLLHGYLSQYEKLFPNPEKIENVCEIGLQRSGNWKIEGKELPSVKMWLEFFPNANFYGFDLKHLHSDNPRVKIMKGNQGNLTDIEILRQFIPEKMDFIIDDGSHEADHQINTFTMLFYKLIKGGVYIIEDCNPLVQKDLPKQKRIHALIKPYLKNKEHYWFDSRSAGSQSSLAIIK